ncbi:MAG: hypothetical protein U0324_18315 [Polyangiales bacterium]
MDPAPDAPPPSTASTVLPTGVSLPELPALPVTVVATESTGPRSIPVDRGAGEVLADLTQRAVDGASQEGAWRTAARAVALLLAALFGLRVVFDAVLPTLLVVALGGAIAVTLAWVVAHAVTEARRQRALLVALAQLSRMSRLDAASRERVAPQVEAVIDALRTPPAPPWKRP